MGNEDKTVVILRVSLNVRVPYFLSKSGYDKYCFLVAADGPQIRDSMTTLGALDAYICMRVTMNQHDSMETYGDDYYSDKEIECIENALSIYSAHDGEIKKMVEDGMESIKKKYVTLVDEVERIIEKSGDSKCVMAEFLGFRKKEPNEFHYKYISPITSELGQAFIFVRQIFRDMIPNLTSTVNGLTQEIENIFQNEAKGLNATVISKYISGHIYDQSVWSESYETWKKTRDKQGNQEESSLKETSETPEE